MPISAYFNDRLTDNCVISAFCTDALPPALSVSCKRYRTSNYISAFAYKWPTFLFFFFFVAGQSR